MDSENPKDSVGRLPASIELQILTMLEHRERPLGAVNIHDALPDRTAASEATIGRYLRDLDRRGYTVKVGKSGRLLTEEGRERLRTLRRLTSMNTQASALVAAVEAGTAQEWVEVMEARMLLESEVAAAAALRVSDEDLREAAAILDRQEAAIAAGGTGEQENLQFHDLLVRISGKRVLGQALKLIRQGPDHSLSASAIRARVGSRRVDDHREIVRALRSRDPEQARAAMVRHISSLIQDVHDFWAGVNPRG